MQSTAIIRACEVVGGQARLAALLGVTPQAVHLWVKRNLCPAERVLGIEQATGGRVARHELRPDLYPPPVLA